MASSSGRNDGPETLIPKALQRLAAIGLPVREHVSGRMGRMHAPPAEFGVPRSSNTAKHRPIQVALNAWNDTFGSEAASLKMAEIQAEKKRLKKARKDVDDATGTHCWACDYTTRLCACPIHRLASRLLHLLHAELLVRTAAEVAAANDRGKTTQDTPVHPAETPTAAPAAEAAPAEGAEHRRKQRAPQPAPLSGSAPEGAPVGDYEVGVLAAATALVMLWPLPVAFAHCTQCRSRFAL